jgi:uncharacterized OsmC-like protein
MATVVAKKTVTQKIHASCPTHARSDISTRDVETVIDEPAERGGTNLGLTPTETLVAALIGCTNVISNKIAHKMGIEFQSMTIDAEAQLDRRGVTLEEEIDVPFPEITLNIKVKTDASEADVQKVSAELKKYCAIAKVVRQSGTKVNEVWTVEKP